MSGSFDSGENAEHSGVGFMEISNIFPTQIAFLLLKWRHLAGYSPSCTGTPHSQYKIEHRLWRMANFTFLGFYLKRFKHRRQK